MRWPHLPVQRPPAATRSPPPLRRRCTLLLLSRPIPARTGTETASTHHSLRSLRARTKSAGGPTDLARQRGPRSGGIRGHARPRGVHRGSRRRAEAPGERDAGSELRAPGGRRLGFWSGAGEGGRDAKLLRGFEMDWDGRGSRGGFMAAGFFFF